MAYALGIAGNGLALNLAGALFAQLLQCQHPLWYLATRRLHHVGDATLWCGQVTVCQVTLKGNDSTLRCGVGR